MAIATPKFGGDLFFGAMINPILIGVAPTRHGSLDPFQDSRWQSFQFSGQIIATENTSFHPKWWWIVREMGPLISGKSCGWWNIIPFNQNFDGLNSPGGKLFMLTYTMGSLRRGGNLMTTKTHGWLTGWSLEKVKIHGYSQPTPPPGHVPPPEIAGLIKGLLTIGFP